MSSTVAELGICKWTGGIWPSFSQCSPLRVCVCVFSRLHVGVYWGCVADIENNCKCDESHGGAARDAMGYITVELSNWSHMRGKRISVTTNQPWGIDIYSEPRRRNIDVSSTSPCLLGGSSWILSVHSSFKVLMLTTLISFIPSTASTLVVVCSGGHWTHIFWQGV